MSQYVNIEGNWIAFAMTWGSLKNPKRQKSDAKDFAKRHKASHILTITSETNSTIGASKNCPRNVKGKIYSAASLVKCAFSDEDTQQVIFVYPLDDGYSLIVIDQGMPYVDIVIQESDVETRIKSIIEETGSHGDYAFFGNWKSAEYKFHEIELEDLIDPDFLETSRLNKYNNIPVVGLITSIIGICVCYAAFSYYEEQQRIASQEEEAKNAVDPVKVYQDNVIQTLKTAGVSTDEILNSIWIPYRLVDASIEGSLLKSVDCDLKQCKEIWDAHDGTVQAFSKVRTIGTKKFNSKDGTLENIVSIKLRHTAIDPTKIPDETSFQNQIEDVRQRNKKMNVNTVVNKPILFAVPSVLSPTQVPDKIAILKGEITFEGPLGLITDFINQQPNVVIRNVSFTVGNDVSKVKFKIVGDYLVKH